MQRELAMNTQGLLMDISAHAHICILKHSFNVVAQLTKICRPVGCCPVRFSSNVVAQLVCRPHDRTPSTRSRPPSLNLPTITTLVLTRLILQPQREMLTHYDTHTRTLQDAGERQRVLGDEGVLGVDGEVDDSQFRYVNLQRQLVVPTRVESYDTCHRHQHHHHQSVVSRTALSTSVKTDDPAKLLNRRRVIHTQRRWYRIARPRLTATVTYPSPSFNVT